MRALIFERRGLDNLVVRDVPSPTVDSGQVKLRIVLAGVNPVDLMAVESLPVSPLPHIPGSEFFGIVEEVGKEVTHVSPGDRVAVYTRLFDGTCESCLRGDQTYCIQGKRIGVESQGGYAEEIVIPSRNVIRSNLPDEILASLPIASLTPYHALRSVGVGPDDTVVVIGASGNTGIFAIQLAKMMGAKVIAISSKPWVKEMGADVVTDYNGAEGTIRELTEGKMGSVVLNSLGEKYWDLGLRLVGNHGKIISFGSLTGGKVQLDMNRIYSKHVSIVGTNRGNMGEFIDLERIAGNLKVKTWKVFDLDEGKDALLALRDGNRDGRIFIKVS
ncbi:alcohol dehydrogenase catalytic domain-containing protein [Metallosphaera hakonensis]|uniref:Alcohol dehydrogenase n=1 Tax=Metallosphaera hakonensis JCM 8857 = DSM 7519 TaxID=1293036 RepID=A0A2U9ISG6_9CREN|nr:alcohol dehydrogenase catalytic domain-containing protein [Metallosphaera hakonensis]AWR98990.1 alcohol dehydrogenase catalytic domain-containing protein [Metallosphaera hakonensis JCM 8857 = DSM 7519]